MFVDMSGAILSAVRPSSRDRQLLAALIYREAFLAFRKRVHPLECSVELHAMPQSQRFPCHVSIGLH